MAEILLIGDTQVRMDSYALTLSAIGHDVELCGTLYAARDRLSGPAVDLAIVDVTSPDGGLGLLCGQIVAAWAKVRTLALTPYHDFSHTKLEQMGLWKPTNALVHPVSDVRLVQSVTQLLAPGVIAQSASSHMQERL
ncbi:MAG: hypothetical protein AB8B85_02140 [Paracoccaceae bacterium]